MSYSKPILLNRRRLALAAAAGVVLGHARLSHASNYPERSVTVICNAEAGGPTDIAARILIEKLNNGPNSRFVIDNRPGASGAIGFQAVRRAKPDGYTVLYAYSGSVTSAPLLAPELGVDPLRDMEAVAVPWEVAPMFFVTHPDSGIKSMKDLIEQARAAPEKLFVSTPGPGLLNTIATTAFLDLVEIKATEVPFKGTASSTTALAGKQVHFSVQQPASFKQFVGTGRIAPLAVIARKRDPEFPDVPTIVELGLSKMMEISEWVAWQGLFVAKGTPREIVATLNASVNRALKDPGLVKRAKDMGLTLHEMDPAAATAFHAKDHANWVRIIARYNLKSS